MRSDRPLLVLLPHPDDEFAILPLLRNAHAAGRPLHLVWLTDGAHGGVDGERRRAESMSVLADCGLQPATCRFLGLEFGFPDGRLHEHLDQAAVALEKAFSGVTCPADLMIPAWEGGHQDHDAVHALGRYWSRGKDVSVMQFPLYHGEGLPGLFFRVLVPLRRLRPVMTLRPSIAESARLLASCMQYRSQWRSFLGLLPALAFHLLLCRRPIVLCPVDASAALERPHEGPLLYERRTPWRWADLRSAVEGFW